MKDIKIGYLYLSKMPFYNISINSLDFKNRPILVIGRSDESDFVALPVSSVSNPLNRDSIYDIEMNLPTVKTTKQSFIRTHKQTIVNQGAIYKEIENIKGIYQDFYAEIILKVKQFNNAI